MLRTCFPSASVADGFSAFERAQRDELTTLPTDTDDWLRRCGWEVITDEP